MENSIQLHFSFDVLSLSYADFIRYIADNGIPLNPDRSINGSMLTCNVDVPEELAVVLKLKFGYFQIKVKSQAEIDAEQAEFIKLYSKMMKEHTAKFFETEYLTKPMKDPYAKDIWYEQSKKKLASKDRHTPWLDGMNF